MIPLGVPGRGSPSRGDTEYDTKYCKGRVGSGQRGPGVLKIFHTDFICEIKESKRSIK